MLPYTVHLTRTVTETVEQHFEVTLDARTVEEAQRVATREVECDPDKYLIDAYGIDEQVSDVEVESAD